MSGCVKPRNSLRGIRSGSRPRSAGNGRYRPRSFLFLFPAGRQVVGCPCDGILKRRPDDAPVYDLELLELLLYLVELGEAPLREIGALLEEAEGLLQADVPDLERPHYVLELGERFFEIQLFLGALLGLAFLGDSIPSLIVPIAFTVLTKSPLETSVRTSSPSRSSPGSRTAVPVDCLMVML